MKVFFSPEFRELPSDYEDPGSSSSDEDNNTVSDNDLEKEGEGQSRDVGDAEDMAAIITTLVQNGRLFEFMCLGIVQYTGKILVPFTRFDLEDDYIMLVKLLADGKELFLALKMANILGNCVRSYSFSLQLLFINGYQQNLVNMSMLQISCMTDFDLSRQHIYCRISIILNTPDFPSVFNVGVIAPSILVISPLPLPYSHYSRLHPQFRSCISNVESLILIYGR